MGTKKILFPLKMNNGEKVYTLEELKEKFDIESVLGYVESGQFTKWLRNRNAIDTAEKIDSLDREAVDFERLVCEAIWGELNEEIIRQIAMVGEQKIQAEKKAKEQLRIEAEKEEEERIKEEKHKSQPPIVLVNDEGIYVVEGNQVIARKNCVVNGKYDVRDFDKHNGVVQEGKYVYYLKNT